MVRAKIRVSSKGSGVNQLILLVALGLATTSGMTQQGSKRPAIIGISHVTLRTHDLAKSREFYGHVLGLAEEKTRGPQEARFRVNGRQYIELIAAGEHAPADRLVEIGFETTNAEELRTFLCERGVEVPGRVSVASDGTRSFEMRDPEGHPISFVQYGGWSRDGWATMAVSRQMIHAGFIVRDRAAEDRFYRDLLGFHVYWHGGMKDSETDWVDMQTPNGTDWLEYMLHVEANPSPREAGVMRHLALGVPDIKPVVRLIQQRGWPMPEKAEIGRDGKWQLNLYDPDLTRVEVMEFRPVVKPCCAPYTGSHPGGQVARGASR